MVDQVTKFLWITSTGFLVTDRSFNYVRVFSREEIERMYPDPENRPERIPGTAIVMQEEVK